MQSRQTCNSIDRKPNNKEECSVVYFFDVPKRKREPNEGIGWMGNTHGRKEVRNGVERIMDVKGWG